MFTVELYAGIRRAVMVDGLSRREAASFNAGLRQPDDVRGPPRSRKKGVWRRRKRRSIIARPWEAPNRIKTQTVLPSAETAAMLFWARLASGQITMRKVDGWKTLADKPSDQPIDLAA